MLQEIVEYGKLQAGPPAEPGFLPKTVRWLLTFSSTGKYLGVVPLAEGPKSKGREFRQCPDARFTSSKEKRQFLVDTAEYALMYGSDKDQSKLKLKHNYFLRLLRDASCVEPFIGKVADAIANDSVRADICRELKLQKAKPTDSVTFAEMRDGQPRIIVEQNTWHEWWRHKFSSMSEKPVKGKKPKSEVKTSQVRCFITGDLCVPCLTHPKIKGLGDVGGRSDTTLISFKPDAFCSYRLKQSANAAVGTQAAEEYAAALNKLIANQSHRLAGAKVVYWYVGDKLPQKEEDPVAELFTGMDFGGAEVEGDPEPQAGNSKTAQAQATSRAGQLLDAIRSGQRPELRSCQYRALTLSGNAGRVVVRDWMQGQFEELVKNVDEWFDDLRLMNLGGRDPIYNPTLEQLATCVLPPRGKT
jgi:CRISPR-associated protein Csd1